MIKLYYFTGETRPITIQRVTADGANEDLTGAVVTYIIKNLSSQAITSGSTTVATLSSGSYTFNPSATTFISASTYRLVFKEELNGHTSYYPLSTDGDISIQVSNL